MQSISTLIQEIPNKKYLVIKMSQKCNCHKTVTLLRYKDCHLLNPRSKTDYAIIQTHHGNPSSNKFKCYVQCVCP